MVALPAFFKVHLPAASTLMTEASELWYVDAGIGIGVGIGTARDDTNDKTGNERAKFLNVIDFIERQTVYVFYKPNSAYGNILDFLNFLGEKSSL